MPDFPTSSSPSSDPVADAEAVRTQRLYEASQTFLLRRPDPRIFWMRAVTIATVLVFLFIGIPLLSQHGIVPAYRVNYLGRYLCYAIVALGIDLVWGYTGLLTLCQALFFALGGYAMAMHLSLKQGGGDVRPEYNDIPQFMFFNNLHELPAFWKPFTSLSFSIFAGMVVPTVAAGIFGFFILRSRVRGVYFSIITQALAAAAWLLISRNEMLLGGTNGLTNFYRPASEAEASHRYIGFYLLTLTILVVAYLACFYLVRSRLGRVLIAVRDKESRLYFAGYKPYAYKVFAFSAGAFLAGIGGMLYPLQMPIITPQNMNVEASIVMVVMVAIGGRGKLWGAIFGALLFSVARSSLSSDFSAAWILVQGLIAISVVLFFPDGFAGLWTTMERNIAGGHSVLRSLLTVVPLVAVAVFVFAEVLDLMPSVLQAERFHPLGIALKYWLLVLIIGGVSATQWWSRRRLAAITRARGLEVLESMPPAESTPPLTTLKGGA